MPEHNQITDPEIHEPKGVSTATADRGYFSDGAGSGSWRKQYVMGWEDVNDTGTVQNLVSSTWTDITNDAAGAQTTSSFVLPGHTSAWDPIANEFNWADAGMMVGDTLDIRFDLTVNVNTSNDKIFLALDMAHGDPIEFRLTVDERNIDTTGDHQVVRSIPVYIGSEEVLNNPTKVVMYADSAGDTVVVNGFFVRYLPVLPVIA